MNKMMTAALGAAGLALAAPAQADRDTPRYTSLTVFGDSLVDAGNIRALGLGANPAQGYFMGRFTNGYDYTDLLSIALFGTPTMPSLGPLAGGTNFAYGGARASNTSCAMRWRARCRSIPRIPRPWRCRRNWCAIPRV